MALFFSFTKNKKFWTKLILVLCTVPVLLFFSIVTIVYLKQDALVKDLILKANADFKGAIRIKGSHVAPFANFPYISIDIEELEVFEEDEFKRSKRIIHISDTYVGFDIKDLLAGNYAVKSIRLSKGAIRLVQHPDGSLNVTSAFETDLPPKKIEEEFNLDLKSIKLDDINLSKLNKSNGLSVGAYITKTTTSFKTQNNHLYIGLDSKFRLSVVQNGDTSFFKNKHFELDTELNLNKNTQVLKMTQTEVLLEGASFEFGGLIDFKNEANVDLRIHGEKQNFDLYLAVMPQDLAESLKKFDNQGSIFFDATIRGKTLNGKQPSINAKFGCKNGFFNNLESKKKLDQIGFNGRFTNGSKRNFSTMRFELQNFSAKPETGTFKGKLAVVNFDSPDIDMNLISDFDLDYLAKFLNVKELKGLSGRVILTMNFHDIIDLKNPEKTIERLNESYYSKLEIKKLKFQTADFHLPLENLNLKATLVGHEAKIEHLNFKIGRSDMQVSGMISDLPAFIHQSPDLVTTDLKINAHFLDLQELTSGDKNMEPFNEQIEELHLRLKFVSAAKALFESKTLPVGEFFIEDLHAQLKHYPHKLHDFHADLFIDDNDFRVMDFSGMIDQSDFHFSGRLDNYNLWFDDQIKGDTKIEFDLTSNLLQFDNIFTYGSERFVPEHYRHEAATQLKLHGIAHFHFDKVLKSTDLQLSNFDGKLKIHPLKFENFNGKIHLENDILSVKNFGGKFGNSDFSLDLSYNLDQNNSKKDNSLLLTAKRLDLDELMNYQLAAPKNELKNVNHDAVFSLYDFDFPVMHLKLAIKEFNYHHHKLTNFYAVAQSEANHVVHIKKMSMDIAGGHMNFSGYLTGKDKKHIYLKPLINVKNVDLDQLMLKFDNFGQDYLLSDNLHGKFSGEISGKIPLHADLVPKIDDADLSIRMTVVNGRLENYGPMLALSNYFDVNKLKSVVFDTLKNNLTIKKSTIELPTMTINSNLGFMEINGSQQISSKMEMNYLIGIPFEIVSQVAEKKLFKKSNLEDENIAEIKYRKENSKLIYFRLSGDFDQYTVRLAKKPKR